MRSWPTLTIRPRERRARKPLHRPAQSTADRGQAVAPTTKQTRHKPDTSPMQVPQFAGAEVAPSWTLPEEAERADVEMDFVCGPTVTGQDLEKRDLEGPGALFFPEVKPSAPEFVGSPQVAELRWDGPGDRGRSEVTVIRAPATWRGRARS